MQRPRGAREKQENAAASKRTASVVSRRSGDRKRARRESDSDWPVPSFVSSQQQTHAGREHSQVASTARLNHEETRMTPPVSDESSASAETQHKGYQVNPRRHCRRQPTNTAYTLLLCLTRSNKLPLLILLMIMHQLAAANHHHLVAAEQSQAARQTSSKITSIHYHNNESTREPRREQTIIGDNFEQAGESGQRKRADITEADLLRSWNAALIGRTKSEPVDEEDEEEKLSRLASGEQLQQALLNKLMNGEPIRQPDLATRSYTNKDDDDDDDYDKRPTSQLQGRMVQKRSQQQLLGALAECNGKCQNLNAVWNLIRTMYPALANHLLALASIGRRHVSQHLRVVGGQAAQIPRLLDKAEQAARLGYHGQRATWLARVAANPIYAKIVQDLQTQLRQRGQQLKAPALAVTTSPKDTRVYGRIIHYPHEADEATAKTLDKLRQLSQQSGLTRPEKVNEIDRSQEAPSSPLDELENNRIPLVATGDGQGGWPNAPRYHTPKTADSARSKVVYGSVHLRPQTQHLDAAGKSTAGLALSTLRQLQTGAQPSTNSEPSLDSYGRIITSPANGNRNSLENQSSLGRLRQQLDEQSVAASSDLLTKVEDSQVGGRGSQHQNGRAQAPNEASFGEMQYMDKEGNIVAPLASPRDEFIID